jgi:hypothetical protein
MTPPNWFAPGVMSHRGSTQLEEESIWAQKLWLPGPRPGPKKPESLAKLAFEWTRKLKEADPFSTLRKFLDREGVPKRDNSASFEV